MGPSVLQGGLPVLYDHERCCVQAFLRDYKEKTLTIGRHHITIAAVSTGTSNSVFGSPASNADPAALTFNGFEFRSAQEIQFLVVATPGRFGSPRREGSATWPLQAGSSGQRPPFCRTHRASKKVTDGRERQQEAQTQQGQCSGNDTPCGDRPVAPAPVQNPPGEQPD
jgi:hypothetical protein